MLEQASAASSEPPVPPMAAYNGLPKAITQTENTTTGSAGSPVRALTSTTLAPSGAQGLLPHACIATMTGLKSRPRSVSKHLHNASYWCQDGCPVAARQVAERTPGRRYG